MLFLRLAAHAKTSVNWNQHLPFLFSKLLRNIGLPNDTFQLADDDEEEDEESDKQKNKALENGYLCQTDFDRNVSFFQKMGELFVDLFDSTTPETNNLILENLQNFINICSPYLGFILLI